MAFLSSLNISASGLTAQRARLDIISENLVHSQTTRTEDGGPYRRKMAVFQSSEESFGTQFANAYSKSSPGVEISEIVEDQSAFNTVYDPSHPDATEEGYVLMPNVDVTQEMLDAMTVTRAYSANLTAFNAMKSMAQQALEIGR